MVKMSNVRKSTSLQVKHKNSKYAGIHLGGKEPKEATEKINIIYQEGEEQLKTSQHERQLLKLLESSGTGTRGIGALPKTQDSVKIAMQSSGKRKSILFGNVLKNQLGNNDILDKKFLGNEISFDRGVTGMQNLSAKRPDKSELRSFMMEQLQKDQIEKKKKRDKSLSKTVNILSTKNKKLSNAYTKEK